MRIVLKPAGAVLVVLVFAVLIVLVVRSGKHPAAAEASEAASASPAAPAAKPEAAAKKPAAPAEPPAATSLQNSGFESDYGPIVPYDNKAKLSGTIAAPWHDDSSWATVTVAYAQEQKNPHSGASCQRIEVQQVTRGKQPNAVQFVQPLRLTKGKSYQATVYLRADRTTPVEFSLREGGWPYTYYASRTVSVGKEWQAVTVEGTVNKDDPTYLMLKLWTPGTVWVDDAAVNPK